MWLQVFSNNSQSSPQKLFNTFLEQHLKFLTIRHCKSASKSPQQMPQTLPKDCPKYEPILPSTGGQTYAKNIPQIYSYKQSKYVF